VLWKILQTLHIDPAVRFVTVVQLLKPRFTITVPCRKSSA